MAPGGKLFTLSPVFSYSPETGAAGGVVALVALPARSEGLTGGGYRIRVSLLYTSEEQSVAEVSTGTPLGRKGCRFAGTVGYRRYPFDFYGIGDDTGGEPVERVVQESAYAALSAGRGVGKGVSLWVRYRFAADGIYWPGGGPPGGQPVPGAGGGLLSGIGFSLLWDGRDAVFFPRSGHAFQATTFAYGKLLGGEHTFTRLSIDLRKYVPVFRSQALAFQLYGGFSGGDPPFYELPRLGGPHLLRGYYEGRFSDRHLMALQAEYRAPLTVRFGAAVFAGAGGVADTLSGFELRELKYSYGFGLRFAVGGSSRVPLRLDFGFGEGSKGVYLSMLEAF
jgi:outer membrane protein assembly factor BamA